MIPLLKIALFAVVIFLITGGLALVNMLINGPSLSEPYPKVLAVTPIAMFLIILGVTGTYLVILFGRNSRNGNGELAKKQFFVGFSLLFSCYVGLELLLNFGLI